VVRRLDVYVVVRIRQPFNTRSGKRISVIHEGRVERCLRATATRSAKVPHGVKPSQAGSAAFGEDLPGDQGHASVVSLAVVLGSSTKRFPD
jgi:hypothetical protein